MNGAAGTRRFPDVSVQSFVTAFPKRHFPAIHQRGGEAGRAIFQSQ
jgi:hypothetical protein